MTSTLWDDARLLTEPPTLRLDGKVAWVTGGGRGLGRACALALSGAGAELFLTGRDAFSLEQVAETIHGAGGVAQTLVGSVEDPESVAAAVAAIQGKWGHVDVLVNNAGTTAASRSELLDYRVWQEVLDVNLSGPFLTSKAAFPHLRVGGSIINISSIHGHTGQRFLAAYSASKGGLELLTRTMAIEWASKGIRVNCVAPGYLTTDMTAELRADEHLRTKLERQIPMGRFAHPSEVVGAVLFLASDASSYVTGSTLAVDGGWLAY